MKKMKCIILLIVFTVLCGCSEKEDKDVLVFPETKFFQGGLTTNNWEEFIQNARMVYVIWVAKEDVNVLEFNSYNLGVYTALKSQLEEQQ